MSRDCISVEFFGMPGVGKSTLSSRAAEILYEKGLSVEQQMYVLAHQISRTKRVAIKVPYVVKEIFINPRYAILSAREILSTKQSSAVDLAKVLFNWFFISSLIRQNGYFHGIRLFEEGIFQASWSIVLSAQRGSASSMLSNLYTLMPTPTVIVIIESRLQTIRHRLSERPGYESRLERWLGNDRNLLERSASLFEEINKILKTISERKQIHSLVISNDRFEDLEANANKIAEYIKSIYTTTVMSAND